MNLRQLLNRPKKPIKSAGKLIYITNLNLFFDSLPAHPDYKKDPSYKDIQRFAIIDEPIIDKNRPYLKNPFWQGHGGVGQDDSKYPYPIKHFWMVNNLETHKHCYIHVDLPLFTDEDFRNKNIEDKDLQERLSIILEKIKEEI